MLVSVGKLVSCYFVIYCTLSTVTSFCYAVCCILFIIYQFPIVQSILFRFYVKRIVVSVQENLYHLQKVTSRISFVTSFCNVQFYMQLGAGAGAPSCSSVASQLDKALFWLAIACVYQQQRVQLLTTNIMKDTDDIQTKLQYNINLDD